MTMQTLMRVLAPITIAAIATVVYAGQGGNAATPVSEATAEAVQEHLDEAEDAVESLLDWHHALTTISREPRETAAPTRPLNTLLVVPRAEVERLTKLIDAAIGMVPKPASPQPSMAARGDLRAHLEKAQEIARELMPAAKPAGQTGSTSASADHITVDRAALERLEVELDAAERVAPRRLEKR
jgi:hypothetical protein